MVWHSAKGFKPVRADRTSLPGRASVPHGSSVIIFTTAAIQQCRINSVRYCGPSRAEVGPQGDPEESQPLLNLSICPRIRRFRPLVEFIALSPVHRAMPSTRWTLLPASFSYDSRVATRSLRSKIFVVRDFYWIENQLRK